MKYIIDLDERGYFHSHVETPTGSVLVEFTEETIKELVEDGFIKSAYDTTGILIYTQYMGFGDTPC